MELHYFVLPTFLLLAMNASISLQSPAVRVARQGDIDELLAELFSDQASSSPDPPVEAVVTEPSCVSSCPKTPEYNPVCGTDNVVYTNQGALDCAVSCGSSDLTVKHFGRCSGDGSV